MARSMWNGAITFGAVNVPVKVFSAVQSKSVSFRELHERDGAPIAHKRMVGNREVPYEKIVKGYETSNDRYVVLTKEEIDAATKPTRKAIDLEHFVAAEEIDPVYYDRPYHLGAGKDGEDAYRLLHDALKKSGKVGVGRVVLRTKEQLVALRAVDGILQMHTMRFHDEVVDPGDLDIPKPQRKPAKREVDMAATLVDQLHEDFDPAAFRDSYRERVLALVKAKASGEAPELPEDPAAEEDHGDLASALEASLAAAKKGR